MNAPRTLIAAIATVLAGGAFAQTTSEPAPPPPVVVAAEPAPVLSKSDRSYVQRVEPRFGTFAGSSENLERLAAGLRRGEDFTLSGSGEKVTIDTPTKPMGYGNITRALDLANRQL